MNTPARFTGPLPLAEGMSKLILTPLEDGRFHREGPRSFVEYRDLGMAQATGGRIGGKHIRAIQPLSGETGWHWHDMTAHFVYVLKGWVEFRFDGLDETVTVPMVLTVVVVRRGFGVVAEGVVAGGGVDAMTKEGTNGPAWVVGVDRRVRTWRADVLATLVVSDADLFILGLARCGDVVVTEMAGRAPNDSENATTAPTRDPNVRRL